MKLLEHLNILAIIEQLNLIHPRIHMVRVLKWSTSCRLVFSRMLQRRSSYFSRGYSISFLPASLMIRYECGFVPLGLFPATIANLISNKLITEENRVQFRYGTDCDKITFISRPHCYEIHITAAVTKTHEVCVAVREIIESAIKRVTSRMNQLAFECPTHPGRG